MSLFQARFVIAVFITFIGCGLLHAQAAGSMSGQITVQLVQGLDSAADPNAMSKGTVTQSSNPLIPAGSFAFVKIKPGPAASGYSANLVFLQINGRTIAAASSSVILTSHSNTGASPRDSASGTRVYLPANTLIDLTLTDASRLTSPAAAAPVQTAPSVPPETAVSTWQQSNFPYGKAVSLEGRGNSSLGSGDVQLVVSCSTTNLLSSTVLIPGPLMTYPANDYANTTTYDPIPKLGRFQVGTGPEVKFLVDANAGDDSPHKLTIDIPDSFYRADLAGKTVKIALLPPLKNQDQHVVLDFAIPSDASPLLAVARPCLRASASAKRSATKKSNP